METLLLIIVAASAPCVVSSPYPREYHFFYELKTWSEAQRYCRENYLDLAVVSTMEDVMILNNMADQSQMAYRIDSYRAWIGLYDDVNSWRWSMSNSGFYQTGEELFRNWKSGEPNNQYSNERCGAMGSDGLWLDVPCSSTLTPVCLDVSGMEGTFVRIDTAMTWAEAQIYCRNDHSDLASVRNLMENQKIQQLVPGLGRVWIGLFRDAWKWSDGSSFPLSYWAPSEPSNQQGNENCVAANFGNSGKWEDWQCTVKRAFICYGKVTKTTVLALRLENTSPLDLNDPAVMEALLNQLKQKLKEEGLSDDDVKLSWRKQSDGNVFNKQQKKMLTSV